MVEQYQGRKEMSIWVDEESVIRRIRLDAEEPCVEPPMKTNYFGKFLGYIVVLITGNNLV